MIKPDPWKCGKDLIRKLLRLIQKVRLPTVGKVTGVKAGTAVISTETGGVHNECTVTVR